MRTRLPPTASPRRTPRIAAALLPVLLGLLACGKPRLHDTDDDRRVAQAEHAFAAAEPPAPAEAEYAREATVGKQDESEHRDIGRLGAAPIGGGADPAGRPSAPAADPGPAPAPGPAARRMVVYEGWIRLAVHLAEELLRAVDDLTERLGGYIESSSLTQRVIRVPSERYDEAVAELRKMGDVRDFRQRTWDVTEQYRNLEARIGNLRALHTRYEALLAEARTMDERLAIEQELRVLEEQRRYLADQAAFATLTVDVETIQPVTVVRDRRPQPFEWVSGYGLAGLLGS
jgi:hypothetical protein